MREITSMPRSGPRIIILDDMFPNPLSGFRVAEYNFYADIFADLSVMCSAPEYEQYASLYDALYPDNQDLHQELDVTELASADLVYVNFLNNAHAFLPHIEAAAVPFVFTLYPGGGFDLGGSSAKKKLSEVLGSRLLRGVISTQRITNSVLREMNCAVPIHEIYGAAINPIYTASVVDNFDMPRKHGPLGVCFAAFNYGDHGRSKGYPEFIAAAELLVERFDGIKLSVVGNYAADDLPLSLGLRSRLEFCGPLNTQELRSFFRTQDLIVSPNTPHRATGGQFDGFPTATCVEASLCGVAMLCADELSLNVHYARDEIIICETDAASILEAVTPYLTCPADLRRLGERGRAKSLRLFSSAAQLVPRAQVLQRAAVSRGRPFGRRYGSSAR